MQIYVKITKENNIMKKTITDFFGTQPKKQVPPQLLSDTTQLATTSNATLEESTHIDNDSPSYDIGYVEWSKMSDMEKVCFLTSPCCPPKNFSGRALSGKTGVKLLDDFLVLNIFPKSTMYFHTLCPKRGFLPSLCLCCFCSRRSYTC